MREIIAIICIVPMVLLIAASLVLLALNDLVFFLVIAAFGLGLFGLILLGQE